MSYAWLRRTRNTWDWVRVWNIVLFSTTTWFCESQTNTKLLVVAFLYDDENKVSHPLARSFVRRGVAFLTTFIIRIKSYTCMRDTNVTLNKLLVKCRSMKSNYDVLTNVVLI